MRRPARPSTLLGVTVLTGTLLLASGGGAVAARLITGDDIADNTLRSRDIRDHTIRGRDVRDGSLTAADFDPTDLPTGAAGPAGPTGPAGADGAPGPAGPAGRDGGPDHVYTWTHTFTADGSNGRTGENGRYQQLLGVSTDTLPAHTKVEGYDIDVTGDFSTCKYASVGVGVVRYGQPRGFAWSESEPASYQPPTRDTLEEQVITEGLAPLAVTAECSNWPDVEYDTIPTFTVTVRFATTDLTAAPETFH